MPEINQFKDANSLKKEIKIINVLYTDLTLFISIILLGLVPPEFGS